MASRRASFTSLSFLRENASPGRLAGAWSASAALHSGQRLAKPGLSGFNSNSSEQTMQTLIGKAITVSRKNTVMIADEIGRFQGAEVPMNSLLKQNVTSNDSC